MNQEKIKDLIKDSYSDKDADLAMEFQFSQAAVDLLKDSGLNVLSRIPSKPGACAQMTAMWTALVRDNSDYPIHAVAGSLSIDNFNFFFEHSSKDDIKLAFRENDMDWDGHCWITLGNYIGDASIFRTAYQGLNSTLKNCITSRFGTGRGLLIASIDNLKKMGIVYNPEYILTDPEITGLIKGIDFTEP
jgi:hypothetical protein